MTAGRDALRAALLDAIARCLGVDPAEADPAEVDDLMGYLIPAVERFAAGQVTDEIVTAAADAWRCDTCREGHRRWAADRTAQVGAAAHGRRSAA